MSLARLLRILAAVIQMFACARSATADGPVPAHDSSSHFPGPRIPADNPMNPAKVQLGRYLFYDKRMSINGTTSCSTCHRQELAFTDGRPQSVGATGQVHPRNAISLANVAWEAALNWSDARTHSLEEQALKPMFSEAPLEMGLGAIRGEFLRLTETDSVYRPLFRRAFPGVAEVYSISNIAKALAAFERTIISSDSP